jgi:hypothetical protein
MENMARITWNVREGEVGDLDGAELMQGYRSTHPVHEPKLGDVLYLPDGSGPWRVVDWLLADRTNSPGNVLVVQPVEQEEPSSSRPPVSHRALTVGT